MRIIKVEIQGFRGFINNAIFEFNDSDIILIYGPNGHGKTSFFDAIEWGLTGKLHRYDTSTDERNRTKFLGNHLTSKAPVVKIFLREEEKEIIVIRTGKKDTGNSTDYGKFDLELFENGKKYEGELSPQEHLAEILVNKEWRHKVTEDKLNNMFNLTHYLGQEKMLHFINETKDKERYDALSTVLGTDYFQFYESRFKAAKELLKKDIEKNDQEENKLIAQQQFLKKEIERLEIDLSSQAINFNEIKESITILKDKFNIELAEHISLEDTIKVVNKINKNLHEESNYINNRKNDLDYINHRVDLYYNAYDKSFEFDLELYERIKELNLKIEEANRILNKVNLVEREIEKLNILNNDYRKIQLFLVQKRRENENSQQVYSKLVKEFESFKLTKKLSPIVQAVKNESIDFKLQEKFINCIEEINALQQMISQLKSKIKHKRNEIENYEDKIDDLKNLNNKFDNLLTVTNEYIEANRDISHCPICGTNNIFYEDILKHITDMKSNELFSTYIWIQTKNDLIQEFESLKKKLKNAEETLREKTIEFYNCLEEFNGYLKIEDTELKNLEKKQYDLQNNIRSLQSNLQDIEEQLLKYNLTLEKGPIFVENALFERLEDLETSRNKCKSKLHMHHDETVEDAIKQLKNKLTELDYQKKEFILLLNKYNKNYQVNLADEDFLVNKELIDSENISLNTFIKKNRLNQSFISNLVPKINAVEKYNNLKGKLSSREKNQEKLTFLNQETEGIKENILILDELIKNVPHTIDKLNDLAIQELFYLMQQIYSKINSHPLYKKLDFQTHNRYRSYKLLFSVITEEEIQSNPTYIYSSAQLRTLALSIFLAMAIKQKWTHLNFLCMDDPIQSMDDLNMMGFIDLIRAMAHEKGVMQQLFISTHDSTFYEMMKKKFSRFNISIIHYYSYEKNGPTFLNENNEVHSTPQVINIKPFSEEAIKKELDSCLVSYSD
ncbi:hypothetical protein COL36_10430 [Bacillus wiedmannii]|uniref:AAA family ATPase n=1 Tax=Bacillus wiedmannii TaxID=1890302 RepID=UPI000BF398AD|nr:SMC family ATPase [Bacillus wiedmannii]PFX61616.1 hypothetical protein COL36_10430 [Bacillus wiedmannii]